MARRAEPRVIDFSLALTPDEQYQAQLAAIRGGVPGIQHPLDIVDGPVTFFERENGTLGYIERDVTKAEMARVTEILSECRAHKDWAHKPSLFFTHPEIRAMRLPYPTLKRLVNGHVLVTRPKAQPAADDVDSDRPRVWTARDLDPTKPKKWLARQRIPWGQMTIMVGDEGIGKSLFWVWVVAAVTTGKPLPEFGIPAREARHVRLIVTEDDWATDVRPRLELAGVDLDYVSLVAARKDGTGTPVFPSDDMELLYEDPVPALVIVDALADTVAPEINMSNAVSARVLLSQWAQYATRTGAAVLILSHTNRMTDAAQVRERYGISAELRKKARMTLFAQLDDDDVLLIGPEKFNGTSPVQASRFKVEPVQVRPPTDDDDGTVGRVVYVGESTKTARQKAEDKKPEFADWLRDLLSDGPVLSAGVLDAAKRDGVSAYQLSRAKEYLLVESFKAKEFQGQWQMRLPAGGVA